MEVIPQALSLIEDYTRVKALNEELQQTVAEQNQQIQKLQEELQQPKIPDSLVQYLRKVEIILLDTNERLEEALMVRFT